MPPDSYVDWGAVHFYTPLNRTGEQILTDEDKNRKLGLQWSKSGEILNAIQTALYLPKLYP